MPVSKKSENNSSAPFWSGPGVTLHLGDVRECLRRLPDQSVHTCITSPPYWGLRDYGTATWEGGSAECDHTTAPSRGDDIRQGDKQGTNAGSRPNTQKICQCGAKRVDAQIGLEEMPDCLGWATGAPCGECFVCHMVEVFREVRRVLRDDATLWLNLGDTFDNGQLLIPTAVAMALRADGWRVVQDIIWYSPNKMPESVQNRCTKSHEHIFLLAKGPGYYYDAVAIEEPSVRAGTIPGGKRYANGDGKYVGATAETLNQAAVPENKNKRDVWIVPTTGYKGAHFATFSPKLITPCILAGTSEYGCCVECGRPYERVVSKTAPRTDEERRLVEAALNKQKINNTPGRSRTSSNTTLGLVDNVLRKDRDRSFPSQRNGLPGSGSTLDTAVPSRETIGWRRACHCRTDEVKPCVVLDPFCGSGTTVATAIQHGRHGVSIDLSEVYLRENAIPRIEEAMRVAAGEPAKKGTLVPPPSDTPPPPRRMR